jgi:hypothetical protein
LEKIDRFGRRYEEFLFTEDKGCGVDPSRRTELFLKDAAARHTDLAAAATHAFISLYRSIGDSWNPAMNVRDIIFFKLFNHRYTVDEGRHRIAILLFKYSDSDFSAFKTDARLIRKDYYRVMVKKHLRSAAKKVIAYK